MIAAHRRNPIGNFVPLGLIAAFVIHPESAPATSPTIEFHVSPAGDDANPGTAEKPFASPERARDRIRGLGVAGKVPCSVQLHGGIHRRNRTFSLEARDSGTDEHPVVYSSLPGQTARLTGGKLLDAGAFEKVTDPAWLERIPESARGKVYMLDLPSHGIERIDPYPDKFTDNGGIFELFFGSRRMPVAIHPNRHGEMTIKRVLINGGGQEKPGSWGVYYNTGTPEQKRALESGLGPRPGVFEFQAEHADAHASWAKVIDRGVWIKGYWRTVWQNETVRVGAIDPEKQTVTLAVPVSHGIGSKYHRPDGSGSEIYWVLNLLEAIDQPGEWAIDFKDRKLFFYPPEDLGSSDILISDSREPVIAMKDASHVELRGLLIEGSLGHGIHVQGGTRNSILGCTVRNVTKYGITIEGGTHHTVRSCDLYALGAGGVGLSGGDSKAKPRIPAGHLVENCDIRHFGEIERVYAPGINVGFSGGGGGSRKLDAVGMTVRHNAIHHGPHAGVLFNSFDNVFEYNEIFQFALVSNDMGAFYSYAKPGGIGNTTIRYNFMHSSPEGDGVYFDHVADHPRVHGNVAYRLGPIDAAKRAKFGSGFLVKNGTNNRVDVFNNLAVGCKVGFKINASEGSLLHHNIAIECGTPGAADREMSIAEAGFRDLATLNLALRDDSPILSEDSRFKPILFEKIGLYRDEFRRELPDYRSECAGWQPSQAPSTYEILDR
ncbi:MAG: right-handed parallel beta-helix repeat-containing protein [Verrucomicrobiota bacterium]